MNSTPANPASDEPQLPSAINPNPAPTVPEWNSWKMSGVEWVVFFLTITLINIIFD